MDERYAEARQALKVLSVVVEKVENEVGLEELPSAAVFRLYSRMTLDDAAIERVFDRLTQAKHWLSLWRDWRSTRYLNQPTEIERVRISVEEIEPLVEHALFAVKQLMGFPESALEAPVDRFLKLRVGVTALVDGRRRVMTVPREQLLEELQTLLKETAWPSGETPG
jgi:hypothetical protein